MAPLVALPDGPWAPWRLSRESTLTETTCRSDSGGCSGRKRRLRLSAVVERVCGLEMGDSCVLLLGDFLKSLISQNRIVGDRQASLLPQFELWFHEKKGRLGLELHSLEPQKQHRGSATNVDEAEANFISDPGEQGMSMYAFSGETQTFTEVELVHIKNQPLNDIDPILLTQWIYSSQHFSSSCQLFSHLSSRFLPSSFSIAAHARLSTVDDFDPKVFWYVLTFAKGEPPQRKKRAFRSTPRCLSFDSLWYGVRISSPLKISQLIR